MSKTVAMKDGTFFVLPNGQLLEIQFTDKGEQDLVEAFGTPYIETEGYGNELFLFVGQAPLAGALMESQVGMMAERCFDRLRTAQMADPYITTDEQLAEMVDLTVDALPEEAGSFIYSFGVHTASGRVIGDVRFPFSAKQLEPPGMEVQPTSPYNLFPWSWLSK